MMWTVDVCTHGLLLAQPPADAKTAQHACSVAWQCTRIFDSARRPCSPSRRKPSITFIGICRSTFDASQVQLHASTGGTFVSARRGGCAVRRLGAPLRLGALDSAWRLALGLARSARERRVGFCRGELGADYNFPMRAWTCTLSRCAHGTLETLDFRRLGMDFEHEAVGSHGNPGILWLLYWPQLI